MVDFIYVSTCYIGCRKDSAKIEMSKAAFERCFGFRVPGGFLRLITCAERVYYKLLGIWKQAKHLVLNIKANKLIRLSLSITFSHVIQGIFISDAGKVKPKWGGADICPRQAA